MGAKTSKYEYLPISKAAPLAGLPVASVRQFANEGRVICKRHATARYVKWSSLVELLGPEVAAILHLDPETIPGKEMSLTVREELLRDAGYLPAPVAYKAAGISKAAIYRWIRGNAVSHIRVTNRYYVKWASLVEVLGDYSELVRLTAKKIPALPVKKKQMQPQGPRVQPGSEMAQRLRKNGYLSVKEAAATVGLGSSAGVKMIRRWINQGHVAATRYGSSILVSKKSLDAYLREG